MKRQLRKVLGSKGFLLFPLDYDIPIKIGELSLGVLKVRFIYDKEVNKYEPPKLQSQITALGSELLLLSSSLSRNVDLSRRLVELALGKDLSLFRFYEMMCHGLEFNLRSFPIPPLSNDDAYIDFIKKEGPRAFQISWIQLMLGRWLSQPNANERIKKLESAMMEYSYGPGPRRLKEGRRPNAPLKVLGKNGIKAMHKEISVILKPLKKNRMSEKDASVRELIKKSFEQYVDDLKRNSEKGDKEQAEKYSRFRIGLLGYTRFADPLSECIEKNSALKNDFFQYDWEPNKFAKEIMAKLFNVSASTIDSVLYRRKRNP